MKEATFAGGNPKILTQKEKEKLNKTFIQRINSFVRKGLKGGKQYAL